MPALEILQYSPDTFFLVIWYQQNYLCDNVTINSCCNVLYMIVYRMRIKVLENIIIRLLSATGTAGIMHGSFYASEKTRVFQIVT